MLQFILHVVRQRYHALQRLLLRAIGRDCLCLLLEDAGRAAGDPGIKNEDTPLQRFPGAARQDERRYNDCLVGSELDKIEAAEGGRVLILLSDRFSASINLDLAA